MGLLTPFRLLVTGSRDWRDPEAVRLELLNVYSHISVPLVVVHGSALGADRYAGSWALAMARHGHPVTEEQHPPNYQKHGTRATHVRNADMAALGADLCLAFLLPCAKPSCEGRPPHDTHGTASMISKARRAGIPVRRIEATVNV